MTMQFPVADQTRVNRPLLDSRADWISPGYDDEIFAGGGHPMAPGSPPSHWLDDPPAADGHKVVVTDTDHYAPGGGDALWAWKSFLRGHHPILMDFGLIGGVDPPDPAFAAARLAMGDTRRFAERVDLLALTPRGDVASTGYALAAPGREYVVLQPAGGARRSRCGWSPATTRSSGSAGRAATFRAPPAVSGPAVLYLTRRPAG